MKILETERLTLRRMTQEDIPALRKIMQDEAVMYAYNGAFSDEEVQTWLDNQLRRYEIDGFGLWAVVRKACGEMIGQCGITTQELHGEFVHEVGYLFQKAHWHMGYATEAAIACKEYAFERLGCAEVFSIIRDTNLASQRVALRNGMSQTGTQVKHYRGAVMPHLVFSIKK